MALLNSGMFADSVLILGIAFFTAFLSEGENCGSLLKASVELTVDCGCRYPVCSSVQNGRLQEIESHCRKTEQEM